MNVYLMFSFIYLGGGCFEYNQSSFLIYLFIVDQESIFFPLVKNSSPSAQN